jgi:hypothetical protein
MRALHTTLALETGTAWTPAMIVKARRPATRRAATPRTETRAAWTQLRNVALFLMAPFVGLLYIVLLPFVGLVMLAWFAGRTFVETGRLAATLRIAKKMVLVAAAPFIALGYVIALPFVGLAMLAGAAIEAMLPAPAR